MAMDNLVMKVPFLFTWLFPFGTYYTLSKLNLLLMYMNWHSLLSTLILCELYMTIVVLGHLQKRAMSPKKENKK